MRTQIRRATAIRQLAAMQDTLLVLHLYFTAVYRYIVSTNIGAVILHHASRVAPGSLSKQFQRLLGEKHMPLNAPRSLLCYEASCFPLKEVESYVHFTPTAGWPVWAPAGGGACLQ